LACVCTCRYWTIVCDNITRRREDNTSDNNVLFTFFLLSKMLEYEQTLNNLKLDFKNPKEMTINFQSSNLLNDQCRAVTNRIYSTSKHFSRVIISVAKRQSHQTHIVLKTWCISSGLFLLYIHRNKYANMKILLQYLLG
jgi:hypothetical protein